MLEKCCYYKNTICQSPPPLHSVLIGCWHGSQENIGLPLPVSASLGPFNDIDYDHDDQDQYQCHNLAFPGSPTAMNQVDWRT